ncbi:hypothetical protein CsSME_00006024 [Camellia sinensis var. sinensis]
MGSSSKTKRSISLPCSRSHPSTVRIEEKLNKIKTWEATSPPTAKAIHNGLSRLDDLYKCMEDLLNLPLTQQALSHDQHEKWVGDLQEGFITLLDTCGTARDVITQMKEQVRDLQSALRRRKGDSSIEISIAKYTCFRKNTKKDAKTLIAMMKQIDNKIEATPQLELDQHVSSVIKVLREVAAVTISILHSLLLFFWRESMLHCTAYAEVIQVKGIRCKLHRTASSLWRLALKMLRMFWSACLGVSLKQGSLF